MKFFSAILITLILIFAFGSAPVAAGEGAADASLFGQLLGGVNTLLNLVLKALFKAINNLLFLLIKSMLNLIILFVPGETPINLATLLPALLALENPTLSNLAATLFTILRVDGTPILELFPASIGNTPINLDTLIEIAAPLVQGKIIKLANFLAALAVYLGKYEYSIKLPFP